MPEKLTPIDIAKEAGVSEDQAADVLDFLVSEGWMLGRYIEFNIRSEANETLFDEPNSSGMHFIVTANGLTSTPTPIQASSPEHAVKKRDIDLDIKEDVNVYPIQPDPHGRVKSWSKDELEL